MTIDPKASNVEKCDNSEGKEGEANEEVREATLELGSDANKGLACE